MSALDRLVSIRTQAVDEVLAHLAASSAALDATPWTWPETSRPIRATDVFVDLDVLTQPHRLDFDLTHRDREPIDEIDAARYELPTSPRRQRLVRWSRLLPSRRNLLVKGAPGSGKSFLTRHTAATRLIQAYGDLYLQRVALTDLPATVWVTATALADVEQPIPIQEALVSAAATSMASPVMTAARARAWLAASLIKSSALIVVDAVDEVTPERYAVLQLRLREVAALPGHILITCRTLQWDLLKRELLPSLVLEEAELAPLAPSALQNLVRRLVAHGEDQGAFALDLLRQNTGLRQACTTPLRLLFVSLLAREGLVTAKTTYAGIYTHLVRALVEGRWRTRRPHWTRSASQVEQILDTLIGIGWVLFSTNPAGNRFSFRQWMAAEGGTREAGQLLEDLVVLGLLVPAGFDQLGDRCWSFVHRTLLEFLAARELARRPVDGWLPEARAHFWFEPEWVEVLTFLASAVPDATPLVAALDREEDDIFGSMLELRARLVGVARHVSPARARRVSLAVFGTVLERAAVLPEARLQRCVHVLGWRHLGSLLTTVVRDHEDARIRRSAAEAIGLIGVSHAAGVLVEALTHDDDAGVRRSAAKALGGVGSGQAEGALKKALHDDSDKFVRADALCALDESGSLGAELLIATLLGDSEGYVRQQAAARLALRGSTEAVMPLLQVLTNDPDGAACGYAAIALGMLGHAGAIEPLSWIAITDPRAAPRRQAARALRALGATARIEEAVRFLSRALREALRSGDRGAEELAMSALASFGAVDPLLEALRSHDAVTRQEAVYALGNLGSDACVEPLLEALRTDCDSWVRGGAALWLAHVETKNRTPALVETLIKALTDASSFVRTQAAATLGEIGTVEVAASLVHTLLGDADWLARKSAAIALGSLGGETSLEHLLRAARDDEREEVRRASAEALAAGRCHARRRIHDSGGRPIGWAAHAAIGLNNFGLQLRDRVRVDEARAMIHRALMLNVKLFGWRHPKVPHRLMNLASVELMRGQHDRAKRLLALGWAWQVHAPDITAVRILTLRLATALVQSEDQSLYIGQLKSIFSRQSLSNLADTRDQWAVRPVLDYVESQVGVDCSKLLRALAEVLNGERTSEAFDHSERWRVQHPVSLDHPWTLPFMLPKPN